MTSLSSFFGVLSHLQEERPWTPPRFEKGSSRPSESISARPRSFGGGSPSSSLGDFSELSEISARPRSSPGDYSKFGELDRAMVAMAG
eukprot:11492117-Heterocapsa_arctica.AAC.1